MENLELLQLIEKSIELCSENIILIKKIIQEEFDILLNYIIIIL